jgi:UDPglucose 6-dehydrogenase
MKIGFYGLTHLGIINAMTAASKGNSVVAFDSSSQVISNIQQGEFLISEKDLAKYFSETRENIFWTSNQQDLGTCDLIYITLDVSTKVDGDRDETEIYSAINNCLNLAKAGTTLVVQSQVLPGTCRKFYALAMKNDVKLFYQVETLVFGEAFEKSLNPERFVVGMHEEMVLSTIYDEYLSQFDCPTLKMNYESAEFTKISINMYLIASIVISDLLSNIAGTIDANWSNISMGIKLDRRIGKYGYHQPSLGINGLNLIRDLKVVQKLQGSSFNAGKKFLETIENISDSRRTWIYDQLIELKLKKSSSVLLCGLAYKYGTNSVANSSSNYAYLKLKSLGQKITYFDQYVSSSLLQGNSAISLESAIKESKVIVITQDTDAYNYSLESMSTDERVKKIVLDPFGKCSHLEGKFLLYRTLAN